MERKPNKRETEDLETEDEPTLEPPLREHKGRGIPRIGFGGESVKTALISLVMAFVVIMGMGYAGGGWFVTKADFTKKIAGIVATMEQAKTDLVKAKSDVVIAIQAIPTTVITQVNSAVAQATSQWNSQLASLSERVNTASSSAQSSASKISDLTTKENSDVVALTTKITGLSVNATDFEKRIKALEDKVTALQKVTTTTANGTTGTASVSSILNGVTATVTPYNPYGVGYGIGYGSQTGAYFITANTTSSTTSFRLSITNTTGKAISNLQLQFGLYYIQSNASFTPCIMVSTDVAIGGYDSPIWTPLSYQTPNMFSFGTGVLNSWGYGPMLAIPADTSNMQPFTCTITTKNLDDEATSQIIIYPSIKVVGFTY